MEQRSITEAEVEAVLADHHTDYTDVAGNPIYIGDVANRTIKVVVAKGTNPALIITTAPKED